MEISLSRHVLRLGALSLALLACTDGVRPVLPHFQSAWINFQFGTAVLPTNTTVVLPKQINGLICPASAIVLENHPTTYPGAFTDGDELVATNNCTAAIDIAYCATAVGGANTSDIPSCEPDPRKTPAGNLRFATLTAHSVTHLHVVIGRTPAAITVNVFYCTSHAEFNLGDDGALDPTECVPGP